MYQGLRQYHRKGISEAEDTPSLSCICQSSGSKICHIPAWPIHFSSGVQGSLWPMISGNGIDVTTVMDMAENVLISVNDKHKCEIVANM